MIKFSPFRNNLIASGVNDGSVSLWDINTRAMSSNFINAHASKVNAIAFSTFNHILLCSASLD